MPIYKKSVLDVGSGPGSYAGPAPGEVRGGGGGGGGIRYMPSSRGGGSQALRRALMGQGGGVDPIELERMRHQQRMELEAMRQAGWGAKNKTDLEREEIRARQRAEESALSRALQERGVSLQERKYTEGLEREAMQAEAEREAARTARREGEGARVIGEKAALGTTAAERPEALGPGAQVFLDKANYWDSIDPWIAEQYRAAVRDLHAGAEEQFSLPGALASMQLSALYGKPPGFLPDVAQNAIGYMQRGARALVPDDTLRGLLGVERAGELESARRGLSDEQMRAAGIQPDLPPQRRFSMDPRESGLRELLGLHPGVALAGALWRQDAAPRPAQDRLLTSRDVAQPSGMPLFRGGSLGVPGAQEDDEAYRRELGRILGEHAGGRITGGPEAMRQRLLRDAGAAQELGLDAEIEALEDGLRDRVRGPKQRKGRRKKR